MGIIIAIIIVITLFVLIKSATRANKENKEIIINIEKSVEIDSKEIDPVSPPENNKDDKNNKEVGDKQTNHKK